MLSKDEPTERLFSAIENGDLRLAESAIRDRASLSRQNQFGLPPLHAAGISNRAEILELLINSGANLRQEDARGNLALEYLFGKAKEIYKAAMRAEKDRTLESEKPRISATTLHSPPDRKKPPIKH